MNKFNFPGFGFVGISLNPHYIEPTVPVLDAMLGHKTPSDLPDFSLLVWSNSFQGIAILRIGPRFDFDKYQHLIQLCDDIDLSGFVAIVFLNDPVSSLFEKLDRRLLTFFAKMQTFLSHERSPGLHNGFPPAMLCAMILGWEDIIGGTSILAFLIWLCLTGLFYLVCYLATLNTLDHITKNSLIKIPLLLSIAPVAAFMVSIFNYNPLMLFLLMMISNYFRVKKLGGPDDKRFQGLTLNRPLFFTASYLYIIALYGFSTWYQHPVEIADDMTTPYWKTWFPDIHEN